MTSVCKIAASITFAIVSLTITAVCLFASGVMQAEPVLKQAVGSGSSWRMTKFGWQDSTAWMSDSFVPQPTLELVHPVILATLVLLTVLAATIWACSEWEYARLFRNAEAKDNEITLKR